jgi:hypothetical protein
MSIVCDFAKPAIAPEEAWEAARTKLAEVVDIANEHPGYLAGSWGITAEVNVTKLAIGAPLVVYRLTEEGLESYITKGDGRDFLRFSEVVGYRFMIYENERCLTTMTIVANRVPDGTKIVNEATGFIYGGHTMPPSRVAERLLRLRARFGVSGVDEILMLRSSMGSCFLVYTNGQPTYVQPLTPGMAVVLGYPRERVSTLSRQNKLGELVVEAVPIEEAAPLLQEQAREKLKYMKERSN